MSNIFRQSSLSVKSQKQAINLESPKLSKIAETIENNIIVKQASQRSIISKNAQISHQPDVSPFGFVG